MATLQMLANAIDTLVKNEKTGNEETDKKETDNEKTDNKETDKKETDNKETDFVDGGVLISHSPSNGLIEKKDCETLHTLNHRLERDFTELQRLKRENIRLVEELRKSQSRYEDEKLTRAIQETRLTELEQKLAIANSKTRNCQENLEILQRKLNKTEQEKDSDQRQIDQLRHRCRTTKEELKDLKFQNENNIREKDRLQENLAKYKAELKQKTEELQSDKVKLTKAMKKINDQRSLSFQLKQEINRYKTLLDLRHLRSRDQVDSGDTKDEEEVQQTESLYTENN